MRIDITAEEPVVPISFDRDEWDEWTPAELDATLDNALTQIEVVMDAPKECVVCHKEPRQHAGNFTGKCMICNEARIYTGDGGMPKLCVLCAKANELCRCCGGDIDLKVRRKTRPCMGQS